MTPTQHILQFFAHHHLPPHLQAVSRPFCELACAVANGQQADDEAAGCVIINKGAPLPDNPERLEALRKLLEAKDCAVRALLAKDA